jgi:hypothetical protein
MAHRPLLPLVTLLALGAAAGAQEMDPDRLAADVASADAGVRHQAAEQLNRCAFYCRSAIPALVKMYQMPDSGDRSEAAFALHQILQDVQARASMESKDERAATAADCAPVLAAARTRMRGAAPAPLEEQLAEVATLKLFGLCGEAEDVGPLAGVMSSPAFSVNARSQALKSLGRMGPAAADAVPLIATLGVSPSDQHGARLKAEAEEVLPLIQPPPAPVKKKKK